MCGETWSVFVTACLYDPPRWLVNLARSWDVLIGIIVVLTVFSFIRFVALWTQEKDTHMKIGRMGNSSKPGSKESSTVLRWLTDYRVYVFLIQFIGSIALVVTLANLRNPQVFLVNSMGASMPPWMLSPSGVEELIQKLQRLEVAGVMWILYCIAALLLLLIDPYGYQKFTLTPLIHDLKKVDIDGENETEWRKGTPVTTRQSQIYFSADGLTLRLTKPKPTAHWITLTFAPSIRVFQKARLSGMSDATDPLRFRLGASGSLDVSSGGVFFVGTDPNNKIYFK